MTRKAEGHDIWTREAGSPSSGSEFSAYLRRSGFESGDFVSGVGYFEGELYDLVDDGTFHIGDDKEVAQTVVCRRCRGRDFNVGKGGYYSAIRCLACGWEACIHDG